MWTAFLSTDSRKNCFVSIPQGWGVNFSHLPVLKLQQAGAPVYVTCIGDTGPLAGEEVVIGAQFARANNLLPGVETAFEVLPSSVMILSTAVAEPCSVEDWELLEMNSEQIQLELMNRVRVVSLGAVIPVWISEFVSLTIRIVEVEPSCLVGLLATDTEIHVSPPKLGPRVGPVTGHKPVTITEVLSRLMDQYIPKDEAEGADPGTSLKLRVLPITESAFTAALAEHHTVFMQPYVAFLSEQHHSPSYARNCVASIHYGNQTTHFNLAFVRDSQHWPIYPNAIYASETVIRQLGLSLKQRVDVVLRPDAAPIHCESITFYTHVLDYDLRAIEKETRMWLQSVCKNDAGLILNHGQHIEIPCLVRGKTNRLFVGLSYKNCPIDYCMINEDSLARVLAKMKVIRVSPRNTPKFVQLPDRLIDPTPISPAVPLGGVADLVEKILEFLQSALGLKNADSNVALSGCRQGNLLLTGSRGSGRTSIARHLCSRLERGPFYVHTVHINCASLKGKKVETLYRDWHVMFQQLADCEPSLVVFDDLDLLASCPSEDQGDSLSGESWYYSRVADALRELVNATPLSNQIIILATALGAKSLYPKLNHHESSHFFTGEFSIPPLSSVSRLEILQKVFENKSLALEPDVNLQDITASMDGYVAADVQHVVDRAAQLAVSESGTTDNIVVGAKHLASVVGDHIPFGLHGINLKPPSDSRIAWSDVGGLVHAKKMLVETLKWPTQYPELFASCPIRLRSALLLYGAPGTGKTMLARAVATECGVNFISIKGPELLSKYIGASEESVRETFRRARSAKPCILFFDEFDSLAPRRGHDSTGVTDRVVNQLLTELDGVEGQESGLWILAASSRPDLIDPALLRPGRFDVTVRCPLPDKSDRLDIMKALSSRLQLNGDVQLEEIAEQTEFFSGADLQALLYTAQLRAVHQLQSDKPYPIHITHQLLMSALRETRPSVSASERRRYDRIYEDFDAGRSGMNSNEQPNSGRVTLA